MSTKKAVTRVVKRVIQTQAEKKVICSAATLYPMALQLTGSVIGGNMLVMTPSESTYGYNIARGSLNNNMIGNKIRICKLMHHIVIYPTFYNVTTNTQCRPTIVRLYYFKSKQFPSYDLDVNYVANYTTTGVSNFFDTGGTDYGFVGGLYDLTRKISTENYTYLTHRTYKIGQSQPPITSGTSADNIYSNNDYKLSVVSQVNLSKYVQAAYDRNDAGHWVKPWIFCLIQVVCGTGEIYTTSQLPIAFQSNIECQYTDD